jgi:hypothetical protein
MVLSTNRPTTPTGPKTSDRLVWLILLPFTLWPVYYWMSIPLSGLFAFLMFGIDEIGVQIEEPFGCVLWEPRRHQGPPVPGFGCTRGWWHQG